MEEEAHSCDYLVLLFCGTLGNNDPEYLGSDESEIIILVWQLLDLVENKVRRFLSSHRSSRVSILLVTKILIWLITPSANGW